MWLAWRNKGLLSVMGGRCKGDIKNKSSSSKCRGRSSYSGSSAQGGSDSGSSSSRRSGDTGKASSLETRWMRNGKSQGKRQCCLPSLQARWVAAAATEAEGGAEGAARRRSRE